VGCEGSAHGHRGAFKVLDLAKEKIASRSRATEDPMIERKYYKNGSSERRGEANIGNRGQARSVAVAKFWSPRLLLLGYGSTRAWLSHRTPRLVRVGVHEVSRLSRCHDQSSSES